MQKIILLASLILVLVASALTGPRNAADYTIQDLRASAEDSLQLCGSYFTKVDYWGPVIVCLPMMGHTQESYWELIDRTELAFRETDSMHSSYPRWVLMDLRGHGCSVLRGSDSLDYRTMPVSEFSKYPADVKAMLDHVAHTPYRDKRYYIVGASIGANTAAILSETLPEAKRLVLLSPGKDYRGLEPANAIKKYTGQILLVATQDDTYSYETVKYFHSLNPKHSTLLIYDGDAHGTGILSNPDAMRDVVNWLLKNKLDGEK